MITSRRVHVKRIKALRCRCCRYPFSVRQKRRAVARIGLSANEADLTRCFACEFDNGNQYDFKGRRAPSVKPVYLCGTNSDGSESPSPRQQIAIRQLEDAGGCHANP